MEIHAAERYEKCDDLWTITCVFNPSGYQSKMDNYHRFAQRFHDAGLPLLTVECAFSGAPFVLPAAPNVISVRSDSVLWQKERLLNIALAHLPPEAKKVAWVDGDLLFSNPNWAIETSQVLETSLVAQPFQNWCRLAENELVFRAGDEDNPLESGVSFAYRNQSDPAAAREERHGFPGYAWAARRTFLEKHGFYDACIIGAGDHMMAHAFSGSTQTVCVNRVMGLIPEKRVLRRLIHPFGRLSHKFAEHYERWAGSVYADTQNNIGFVPGHLLHLWHGSLENRRYHKRHEELRGFHYDPETDLWKNSDGTWEWSEKRGDMRRWAENYFRQRREDG